MPSFVQVGAARVNVDHIVSVEPKSDARSEVRYVMTLTDGRTLDCADDLGGLGGVIVPAPPGLVMVEAFPPRAADTDRTVDYFTTMVIAFRVVGKETPIPIGLDGEPSPENSTVVIQPDGQCVGWSMTWDSLDAFKASQEAAANAQHQETPVAPKPAETRSEGRGETRLTPHGSAGNRKAAPETVEQLRARILAEPIQAVHEDAPWQLGRDFAGVIAEVQDAHPDLHTFGVGYNRAWGWKWKPGEQDRARDSMTSQGHVEEFERALRFLSHANRRFPQSKINRDRTSYSWKHVAERVMGGYVSNGMLVAAAYALGFTVATNDSPNPCINLGDKAADLDPQRGL